MEWLDRGLRSLLMLVCITYIGAYTGTTHAKTPLEALVQDFLAQTYAQASLFNNSDVMTFGIWDFDPNQFVDTGDSNFGSGQSVRKRQSVRQFNIPFRVSVSPAEQESEVSFIAKLGFLDVNQELQLLPSNDPTLDRVHERILSAGAGLSYLKPLDDHWEISLESTLSWMNYQNDVDFNTTESKAVGPLLNGILTNINTELLMAEPAIGLHFNWFGGKDKYQLFSKPHFMYGWAINPEIEAFDTEPNAWYWSNGIAMLSPFDTPGWENHSLWFRLTRNDLGGDLENVLGESSYYEAGIAWLFNSTSSDAFFENIGAGINLNYGSDLRGGTLILLYNFDGVRSAIKR